jgi:hypothetical protein
VLFPEVIAMSSPTLAAPRHFSGELADELLIHSLYLDLGVFVHRDREAGWDGV